MKTLDMVRKDLSEFSEAMTTEVVELTSAAKGGEYIFYLLIILIVLF